MASNRNDHMTPEVNRLIIRLSQLEDDFIDMYRPHKTHVREEIERIFDQLPPDMTNRMFLHRYYRVIYMHNSIVTRDLPADQVESFQHGWHEAMEIHHFSKAPPNIANMLDLKRHPRIVHLWERFARDRAMAAAQA